MNRTKNTKRNAKNNTKTHHPIMTTLIAAAIPGLMEDNEKFLTHEQSIHLCLGWLIGKLHCSKKDKMDSQTAEGAIQRALFFFDHGGNSFVKEYAKYLRFDMMTPQKMEENTKLANKYGKDATDTDENPTTIEGLLKLQDNFFPKEIAMSLCVDWLIGTVILETNTKPKTIKTVKDAVHHTLNVFQQKGEAFVKEYSKHVYESIRTDIEEKI